MNIETHTLKKLVYGSRISLLSIQLILFDMNQRRLLEIGSINDERIDKKIVVRLFLELQKLLPLHFILLLNYSMQIKLVPGFSHIVATSEGTIYNTIT